MATVKQRKAFKALGENGGNISAAMKKAGYSPTIVHATEKLTKSKGFQELMDQYLPDDLLIKVHLDGLQAEKETFSGNKVPDYPTRHKYLETAYDVKKLKSLNLNLTIPQPIYGGKSVSRHDGDAENLPAVKENPSG